MHMCIRLVSRHQVLRLAAAARHRSASHGDGPAFSMICSWASTTNIVLLVTLIAMDAPDLAAAEVHALQHRNASLARHEGSLSQSSKDFAAGAFGGMLGVIAGQPLDTLRIRMQQAHCTHRNVVGLWRSMAKAEGVRGLFKGMSYPLYTTALQNAVTFQAQRAALRWLDTSSSTNINSTSSNTTHGVSAHGGRDSSSVTPTAGADSSSSSSSSSSEGGGLHITSWRHTGLAGMFAGGVQTLISCPVELLKIRLQLQQAMPGGAGYVGPWAMAGQVVAGEGVAGLFRGFWLTFLRDVPSYGLYFITYDWAVQASCDLLNRARASLAAHQDRHSSPALSSDGGSSSSSSGLMLAMPAAMAGGAGTTAGWAAAAAVAAGPKLHHAGGEPEGGSAWHDTTTNSSSSNSQRLVGRKEGAFAVHLDANSDSSGSGSSSSLFHLGASQDASSSGGGSSSTAGGAEGGGGWAPLGPDSALVQLLAGGFAGALAWFSIYPLDILKSRVQAADMLHHTAAASAAASPFSRGAGSLSAPLLPPGGPCPPALCPPAPPLAPGGAWAHAVEAVNKEGWRVFTKGLGPTLGRAFLVNAVIFAGFEAAMRGLDPL